MKRGFEIDWFWLFLIITAIMMGLPEIIKALK